MEIKTDPFTAVYDELWGILLDSAEFASSVKENNRIVYTGALEKRNPEKAEVSTHDFPECRMLAAGFTPHLQRTSNSSSVVSRFSIEMRTGSKALDHLHFPMIWAVYRAMASWATRLSALTWNNGQRFVILSRPVGDTVEDIERGEVSRGIEGWFAIWTIEVTMFFATEGL